MENTSLYFLILAIIPFLGFIGEILFKRTKIHSSLWLVLFGILISGFINIELFKELSGIISGIALSFILFNAGLNINIKKFIDVFDKGCIITIINALISIIFTFPIFYIVFKLNFVTSLLLSVILCGISSIVIIPLIQKLEFLPEKTKIIILLESTLTDVLVIILSIVIYQIFVLNVGNIIDGMKMVFNNFTIGAVIGILLGVFYLKLNKIIYREEYPYVIIISLLFLSYFLSEYLGGNGGIAALFLGLTMGNSKHFSKFFFIESQEIDYLSKHIFGLLTFLIVSFFFVYMGLFFNLYDLQVILSGLIVSIVILLSRLVSINTFGKYFKLRESEIKIFSVLIARGLSAGIMAFFFYEKGVLNGFCINIIFSTVLFTILITTFATKYVLSKLKKVKL